MAFCHALLQYVGSTLPIIIPRIFHPHMHVYRFATVLVILHASTASMFCSRFTPDVVLEGSAVDLMADGLEPLYSNALRWLNTNIKIQIKMVIGSRSCSWKVN